MSAEPAGLTLLLQRWIDGDRDALERILPLIYTELHAMAIRHMRNEREEHTLQPTALIHEVYLRLVDQSLPSIRNRSHFFAIAAHLMRQILVDFARKRMTQRRGGGARAEFSEDYAAIDRRSAELLELHTALDRLAAQDSRKAKVIELRYFGGLLREDIAEVLGVSLGTVKRDVMLGEAWLRRELSGTPALFAAE